MMASSQVVEIAASSPFGCVLKDHNSRRDRRRDQNQNSNPKPQSNFQRNLKELVRDHLHSCISISPKGSSYNHHQTEHDENSHHHQSSSNFSSCFGGGGGGSNSKNNNHNNNNNNNNNNNSDNKNRSHGTQNAGSRLAPHKAKEMITTIERQNQEADVIILSPSRCSSRGSTCMREPSPAPSDSDISVSSLVQKWRGFEACNKKGVAMQNNNDEMSRESSVVSICESTVTSITIAEGKQGVKQENEGKDEEMQGNLEDSPLTSDVEAREQQQQQQGEDFLLLADGGERERMRVSDIVRKWARTGQGVSASDEGCNQEQQQLPFGACLARLKIGMDSGVNGEQRGVFSPQVVCSPKLRGRQAIADLFMRMERERYKEVESLATRQAVTKFPQRGRIQSLVRLQCLRRDVDRKEQQPPQQPTVGSERPQTASSIISLRERFNITAEQDSFNLRSPRRDTVSIKQEVGSTSTSNQKSEQTKINDNVNSIVIHKETTSNRQEVVIATAVTIDEPQHTTDLENLNLGSCQSQTTDRDPVVEINLSSAEDSEPENSTCEEEYSRPTPLQARDEELVQPILTQVVMDQTQVKEVEIVQPSLSQVMEQLQQEIVSRLNSEMREEVVSRIETQDAPETATTGNGWQDQEEEEEEEEMFDDYQDDHQYCEPNLDWIADIARPRSYWEDLRQSWYQEVYTTRSQDEEIRQLLERGSVSAVLASDFKERMDQLMTSSVQRTAHYSGFSEDEDNRSARVFLQSQTLTLIDHQNQEEIHHDQENVQVLSTEEVRQVERIGEDEEEREVVVNSAEEDGEEEEASSMHQYQDVGDYYDHASSQSQSPWGHYADHEASEDSDHAASTPLQQPSLVPSYDHDTQEGSSYKNSSIEMELIYDLRSHMEQLYREMSELRKSMTSCMDMQIKLQSSIREEVAAAINPRRREESKDTNRRRPKKGSCCICYEKKVDSLLYRCGHMCTCFDCARELQWSSGKCPICRAQIADVVRAYPDT